jgi:3-dehydroquinate dehydratase-2
MVINGPNLNMVGIREKEIYGSNTFESLIAMIRFAAEERGIEADCRQSNHEGDLVDWIQEAYFKQYDGIVINPGAYTHTSVALLDAVKAVRIQPVEVHLPAVEQREDFRQVSYIRAACIGTITGQGTDGYLRAVDLLLEARHDG